MQTMRIFDTHCHPQFPQFDQDRDAIIRRALDSGIGMICVGTDLRTSRSAIDLAERYEGLYASVGLHPNDDLSENYQQGSYADLARHAKVVAIGEVGLDYYRTVESEQKERQRIRFRQQLELAHSLGKPVIIHCRDAHEDMIAELKEDRRKNGESIRGVIHSFNGSVAQAETYIDEGFYIGLNAIVTFSPAYETMVRSIPSERMLLETDAPYLAPSPHRGKRNEPAYVDIVAGLIANIRREETSSLITSSVENARNLFTI